MPSIVVTAPLPAAAANDGASARIDELFRQWGAATYAANHTDPEISDEEAYKLDDVAIAVERAVDAEPPSITKAAAIALFRLNAGIIGLDTTPAQATGPDARKFADADAMLTLDILPCLLPHLSGTVLAVTADFLAHPHRPVCDSLLHNQDRWEA